jgi:hypothetical protein
MTESPYFPVSAAAACFYAGAPTESRKSTFLALFINLEPELKYRLAEIIAASPENDLRNAVLDAFLADPDLGLRRLALGAYSRGPRKRVPQSLVRLLAVEKDPLLISGVLEIAGKTLNKDYLPMIEQYMEDRDPLIAIAACGQYLRVKGGGK